MDTAGARFHGGRWNPQQSFACLYLGTTKATARAEFLRAAAKQGVGADELLPRNLYRFDVGFEAVIDLRSLATVRQLRLTTDDLISDDTTLTKRIGEAAQRLAVEALLAPSASGVGDALAVFVDNVVEGSILEPRLVEHWDQFEP